MQNLEKQFKHLKNIHLKEDEKLILRARILQEIRQKPVRTPDLNRQIQWSNIFSSLSVLRRKKIMVPIIIAIILATTGGVSLAAQNSLPGEALYGVKVRINEKVRAALALNEEDKAEVEADAAEERLEEAEELAAAGKFDADVAERLEANFKLHADRVNARIDAFKARQDFRAAADVSSNFETSLRVHDRILEILNSRLVNLKVEVNEEADKAEEHRETSEAKVKTDTTARAETAAQGKLGAAENKIAEVESFLAKVETRLEGSDLTRANEKLADAKELIAEGKVLLEEGKFGEAFVTFQKAHRKAQEAKLLVLAKLELKIDVDVRTEEDHRETQSRGSNATGNGTLLLTAKVEPICPVERVGIPCVATSATFTSRQAIVYKSDGVTEVTRANFDSNGEIKLSLAPGDYVVNIGRLGIDHLTNGPHRVKVLANTTTRVTLVIDTGIR